MQQLRVFLFLFIHGGTSSVVMPATVEICIGRVQQQNEENCIGEPDSPAVKHVWLANKKRHQKDIDLYQDTRRSAEDSPCILLLMFIKSGLHFVVKRAMNHAVFKLHHISIASAIHK